MKRERQRGNARKHRNASDQRHLYNNQSRRAIAAAQTQQQKHQMEKVLLFLGVSFAWHPYKNEAEYISALLW